MAGKKMSQANFTATKDLRVCYQHFERHCYKRDLKSEMLRISAKKIFEAYNPRLSPEKRRREQAKNEFLSCKH